MRTQPGFFMRNCSLRVYTGIVLKEPVVLHGSSDNYSKANGSGILMCSRLLIP